MRFCEKCGDVCRPQKVNCATWMLLGTVEPGTLVPILRTLLLSSLNQDDSLDSLKKVVLEV